MSFTFARGEFEKYQEVGLSGLKTVFRSANMSHVLRCAKGGYKRETERDTQRFCKSHERCLLRCRT